MLALRCTTHHKAATPSSYNFFFFLETNKNKNCSSSFDVRTDNFH